MLDKINVQHNKLGLKLQLYTWTIMTSSGKFIIFNDLLPTKSINDL